MGVQDYGTYEFVTIDSIIAASKMRLGIRDSDECNMYLKDLCIEGFKKIGARQSYVQAVLQLPVENARAKLPGNFCMVNKFNGVAFVEADGEAAPQNNGWAEPAYTGNPFYKNSPYNGWSISSYCESFNVENGYIYFDSNVSAEFVLIACLVTAQDENGDIVIPESYQNFLIPYCCWQYGLTYDYAPFKVASWEKMYRTNIKAVRGLVNLPDAPQNQLIAYKMNSIV